MADSLIILRPNRELIDASFDRYILTNEKLAMRKIDLKHKAHFQMPSNEQFAFQHVKTFSGLQRLIYDDIGSTGDVDVCFTILENGVILSARFDKKELTWLSPVEVALIECVSPSAGEDENLYPPTLLLVDHHTAVASDGCGTLTLFHTGERHEHKKWTPFKLTAEPAAVPPAALADVQAYGASVEVLLQTVVGAKNAELEKIVFTTHLIWLTLERSENAYKLARRRELASEGRLEFATLSAAADAVFVVGSGLPVFLADSAKAVNSAAGQAAIAADETTSENETKRENAAAAASDGDAKPPTSDAKPADEVDIIGFLGMNLMFSNLPMATDYTSPLFNSEQLEDCDQSVDSAFGYLISGETHRIVETVDFVGNPVLFTARQTVGALSFATRHDVDGLVWQLNDATGGNDENKIASHKLTLHAFGYIQAGHSEKQFIGCSPDGQYAVIVNRRNHVFVYFQNAAVDKQCELKNRKTGIVKTTVAKEVIFALSQADADYNINEPDNEYIGFHAAHDFLYLLMHNALVAVHVKIDKD